MNPLHFLIGVVVVVVLLQMAGCTQPEYISTTVEYEVTT